MSSLRITPEELDQFINDGTNLYELLNFKDPSTASEREVRRNYRKQALIYHPDKNPSEEARLKFDLISKALEVLTTLELKTEYDKKLLLLSLAKLQNEHLSKNLQDLRLNLRQNEQRHKDNIEKNKRRQLKVELLKRDALKRIAAREQELNSRVQNKISSSSTSSSHLSRNYKLKYTSKPPLLKLKWKLKKEVPDILSNGVILQLMEIFGEVLKIQKYPSDDADKSHDKQDSKRYAYCLIQYKDFDGVHKALKHDYTKTSAIWDNSGLRKLSSLLRSVEVFNEHNDNDENENEVYFEDYFDKVIARMNSV